MVTAHKFFAHKRHAVYCHTLTRIGIDVINCAIKYTTKMKTKVSKSDQIKFNETVLKPEIPE